MRGLSCVPNPIAVGFVVLALLLSAAAGSSNAASRGQQVEPLPEVMRSDARLDQTVTLWQEVVTLREALAQVSSQQPVRLVASEEVANLRITAFTRDCPLRDLMEALAEVCEGRWEAPPLDEMTGYRLTGTALRTRPEEVDRILEARFREAQQREHASARQDREARLKLYRESLLLTQEQLLEQYEKTDPWLCVDLLDPQTHPLITEVCALSDSYQDRLLREGQLALPLRHFAAPFRRHLAEWVTDTQHAPRGAGISASVDRLPRFLLPEERWENSVVQLRWLDRRLTMSVDVPDVYRFDREIVHTQLNPPLSARQSLVGMGVRRDTPEYREAAKKEQQEWAAAHPEAMRPGGASRELPFAFLTTSPDEADSRCQTPFVLDAGATQTWSAPALLEQLAESCQVSVMANYLPEEALSLRARQLTDLQPATLGGLMNLIRARRGGTWTWAFHGSCLAAHDADSPLIEASEVAQPILRDLEARCAAGGAMPLTELAVLAAGLNPMQLETVRKRVGALQEVLFYDFSLHGGLSPEQRTRLASTEGVAIEELSPEQRREVLRIAQRLRPWIGEVELESTVLRTLSRRLAIGEEGISFVIEYHFPDSPNDRDVVFTLPLQIPLGPVPGG